jgi:hypothetical protein
MTPESVTIVLPLPAKVLQPNHAVAIRFFPRQSGYQGKKTSK